MYANLKGLEAEHLEEIVSSKLAQCGLNEADSDKISSEYSGGMRRKLSVAIATVANPPVVVLDEPGYIHYELTFSTIFCSLATLVLR